MNEEGLFIWEMTLAATQFVKDENLPKLFMMQWMQYQLDNFKTIDEVIQNSGKIALDGWGWHFFVADRSGKAAIIEFLDGRPVVYSDTQMPIPLLANNEYSEEIKWLKNFKGFGGELDIIPGDKMIPRFIHGAQMLHDFSSQDPIEYSFNILEEMSRNVRWAIVFDPSHMQVYFKTNLNQSIRSFSFSARDFAKTNSPLMLDIGCPGSGEVKNQFSPYAKEKDEKLLVSFFNMFYEASEDYRKIIEDQNTDNEMVVRSILKKMDVIDQTTNYDIIGEWKGKVQYPARSGMTELPITLNLNRENGKLTGKVNDGVVLKNLPLTNADSAGALMSFTVKETRGYILLFQLSVSENEINGSIYFNRDLEPRKGAVRLFRTANTN